jgi:hypothetical protein
MEHMIQALEIFKLHDDYLNDLAWPKNFKLKYQASNTLYEFIEANHFFNTKLWNEEDLARRQKVSDTEIASNKRAIDKFNQARNDYIEKIDDFIISSIPLLSEMLGEQNSETLGAMIDRSSILSLKIYHMFLQTERKDVEVAHINSCSQKLIILNKQRYDLGGCFDDLLKDCKNGKRHFKQYKQFKMYNDPNLNPQMYSEK